MPKRGVTPFGREFDNALRWAKHLVGPFVYRTKDRLLNCGEECDGVYFRWKKRHHIYISRTCGEPLDCLLHELGHLIDTEKNGEKPDHYTQHGRGWSDSYGFVYRHYHEWRRAQTTDS